MEKLNVEGNEDRARRLVADYYYIFQTGCPKRIFVWAWHVMPKLIGSSISGSEVIDFYKKLGNKKQYFLLLEELGLKKTFYEENL